MMIALAVVLWQMASKPAGQKSGSSMSYSDFMDQVDKNNVSTARLFEFREAADIEGELRQPPEKFKVSIPKEVIPDLTERLRKQGVTITVSGATESNWVNVLINFSPIILIVGLWIFMMRQMRARRGQSAPGDPSNRPIQ
jgi:cell division protease FtsH